MNFPEPESYHRPVLLAESLEYLAVRPGGVYVDGTMGGGGHSRAILELLGPTGLLISVDRDEEAHREALEWAPAHGERVRVVKGNYSETAGILEDAGLGGADGILLDLGVSSRQLDSGERGFSFIRPGPLDMRMDRGSGPSAADLVNTLPEAQLTRLFREYGEEPRAKRAAKALTAARERKPLARAEELAEVIERALGRSGAKHPATRVFQALRIAVNGELDALREFLSTLPGVLNPGGRVVVISYHSLEDRMVKTAFREREPRCVCPEFAPRCVCGEPGTMRVLTRKAVMPSEAEVAANSRARSAKLRAAERLPHPPQIG